MSYVLFDINHDLTKVTVSENLREVGKVVQFKTKQKLDDTVKDIFKAVESLTKDEIRAVSGGVSGVLNGDNTEIIHNDNLKSWIEEPLSEILEKAFSASVSLENNCTLAGLGEAVYGAGEGHEVVVFHSVGDVVGGVKVENGQVDVYAEGFEPGLQILDIDHTILGEEVEPTLENLVSRSAVENRINGKIEDTDQTDAVWDQLANFLAHGLRNSILYWSPDILVLGGSMVLGEPAIKLDAILENTNEILGDEIPCPIITTAKLGDHSALYGAMSLLEKTV